LAELLNLLDLSNSLPPAFRNTRMAYARAVKQFFDWCDERRLKLADIEAISVATYIEQLGAKASKPTVKQHLAAIRQLFDYLTTGGILEVNPAASALGPRYVVKRARLRCCHPRRHASCSIQLNGVAAASVVGSPRESLPEAPADPDVRISRIRLFGSRLRYVTGDEMCGCGSG
jgi:hypothetical protein